MPPSWASAIAMSASVTVSIADDRIGMLSGISRVRRVRVSAWLGSTLDSSGCNSTSSKVRPSGMSAGSLWSAISAHAKVKPVRQGVGRGRRPRSCANVPNVHGNGRVLAAHDLGEKERAADAKAQQPFELLFCKLDDAAQRPFGWKADVGLCFHSVKNRTAKTRVAFQRRLSKPAGEGPTYEIQFFCLAQCVMCTERMRCASCATIRFQAFASAGRGASSRTP